MLFELNNTFDIFQLSFELNYTVLKMKDQQWYTWKLDNIKDGYPNMKIEWSCL